MRQRDLRVHILRLHPSTVGFKGSKREAIKGRKSPEIEAALQRLVKGATGAGLGPVRGRLASK